MKRLRLAISLVVSLVVVTAMVQNHQASATVPGVNVLQSQDSSGNYGDHDDVSVDISADGRYVAFESDATNLVSGDTNSSPDIFVHDNVTGTTARVSVSTAGVQANSGSTALAVSYDGRYVAFDSDASNLVPGDTNGVSDVFVRDTVNNTTTRVSTNSSGTQGNYPSSYPAITPNGRYVVFESDSTNLDSSISSWGGYSETFIKDLKTGLTKTVSVDSGGTVGTGYNGSASISCDGGVVVFTSASSNYVAGDTNGVNDVFVVDRTNGNNEITNITLGGDARSQNGRVSCDGNYVTFTSDADNLTADTLTSPENVYSYSLVDHTTKLISTDSSGNDANNISGDSSLSNDGRYVAFTSSATNLSATSPSWTEEYVKDTKTGATYLISVNPSTSAPGHGYAAVPRISQDGAYLAYVSSAGDLTSPATSGEQAFRSETGL